jgi:hypothetical protein
MSPASSTTPAATLVPPMSTPMLSNGTDEVLAMLRRVAVPKVVSLRPVS